MNKLPYPTLHWIIFWILTIWIFYSINPAYTGFFTYIFKSFVTLCFSMLFAVGLWVHLIWFPLWIFNVNGMKDDDPMEGHWGPEKH